MFNYYFLGEHFKLIRGERLYVTSNNSASTKASEATLTDYHKIFFKSMSKEDLYQDEEEILENFSSTQELLQQISKESDAFFMIQRKACSLLSDLKQHPELLEQIQEIASHLSLLLQEEKRKAHTIHSLIVPQKLEASFRYFRDTPISYLKGIRMGFIITLFQNLGIEVDRKREGSRVHFGYKEHHTSIHIHDKENGALDGGRLNSLRKFLLDLGWIIKEEIS